MDLGLSNMDAVLLDATAPRIAAAQLEWSLLARDAEDEVVPAASGLGVGVVPYFPLASGLLTGKYRKGEEFPEGSRLQAMPYFASVATEENLERVERLRGFAEAGGHSLLELALGWLLAQPAVTSVICGATTPEQVRANAAAAGWALDGADLDEVELLLAGGGYRLSEPATSSSRRRRRCRRR